MRQMLGVTSYHVPDQNRPSHSERYGPRARETKRKRRKERERKRVKTRAKRKRENCNSSHLSGRQ
eukprot:774503-Rhodomonas_salina.2